MSESAEGAPSATHGLAMLAGGAILTFLFLIVALSEFGWLLGMPIRGWVLPAALVGSCLANGWGARMYFSRPLRARLVVSALIVILVALSAWTSLRFFDVSFDGQAYQQEGVYQLAHGWNPFTTRYISPISTDQNVKLIAFPKGPWMVAASMYRLTGHIETGKFANPLLVFSAFCMGLAVLTRTQKRLGGWSAIWAILVAANPVAVCQVFTFYVDGQLASLLACVAALCFLSFDDDNPWVNLLVFEASVLAILVKFTGLVYVVIFFAGFIAVSAWQKRSLRKPLYVALVALVMGTIVLGKNPYVDNTVENGHPFYPFFGTGDFAKITMVRTTPPAYFEANRVANLAASIFSRTRTWPPQSTLKAPWQIDRDEWSAFSEPDVITGGFGPLFAVALVLSLLLLAVGMAQRRAASWLAMAVILVLVGSVLPVSACWWARYSPQVWLIPLAALAPLAASAERRILHGLSWLVLLILSVNVAGIGIVNFRANRQATRDTAAALEDLRSHAPFRVAFGYFHSNRFRLQEAGIPFIEKDGKLNCDPEVKENDDLCVEPNTHH